MATGLRIQHPFRALLNWHSKEPEASNNCANPSLGIKVETVQILPSHCLDVVKSTV